MREHDDWNIEPVGLHPARWMLHGFAIGLAFAVGKMIGRMEQRRAIAETWDYRE